MSQIWKTTDPTAPGWCAVLVRWEATEADAGETFPQSLYWDGARWCADDEGTLSHDPVAAWAGPFSDGATARTFAWENEPGRDEGMTADEAGDEDNII